MKVALLGLYGDFSTNTGNGIQRYMFEIYKNLKKMDNNIDKIEFKKISFIGSGLSFELKTFFANLNDYDILHNLDAIPFSNPRFLRKSILITTAHDFQPLLYPEFTFEHNVSLKDRLWLEFVVKPGLHSTLASDYIIADSTQTRAEAVRLGFDPRKVFVSNLGLDYRFTEQKKTYKKNPTFTVGYIGAMRKRKNVEFAIRAFNRINDSKISFEIWGKPEFEYDYLRTIAKNRNIAFKGFAPENKIVDIYDSFDCFVFPSLHEGLGLPILEAQVRGLPVIIYKNGKIPKEVRKYCFEAESPEHMAQIIEQIKEKGYNKKLKKRAVEYARKFTWKKTAMETAKLYKKIHNI